MLIGSNGEKKGLVDLSEALESAKAVSLDLVQVSPSDADPLVCKLLDYGKHVFDKKKSLELRHKIMDFYRNQWVSIFLYQAVRFAGIKKNLKGFSEVHNFIPYEDMYFMN